MKKLLIVFAILSSCTVQQDPVDPSLKSKRNSYPFFDISVVDFIAMNQPSNDPSATAEDQQNAKIILKSEKRKILEALDSIRFTIHTTEFENNMLSKSYIAGNDFFGPNGVVIKGNPYPNNQRLLQVIRNRSAGVVIRKQSMPINTFAQGELPVDSRGNFFNAYVGSDTDPLNKDTFIIALNNRKRWDDPNFYVDEGFLAGVTFHELLHNMGFTHADPLDTTKDTVYVLQGVLEETYNNTQWQSRYRSELANFRPYYPELYSLFLTKDTVPLARLGFDSGNEIMIPLIDKQLYSIKQMQDYHDHHDHDHNDHTHDHKTHRYQSPSNPDLEMECIYNPITGLFEVRTYYKGKLI